VRLNEPLLITILRHLRNCDFIGRHSSWNSSEILEINVTYPVQYLGFHFSDLKRAVKETMFENTFMYWDRTYSFLDCLAAMTRSAQFPSPFCFSWLPKFKLKSTMFRDITPCSPLKVNRHFGGTYYYAEPCLSPAFGLVSCSAYSSTLKMEAICTSDTSVDFQRTTRHCIPEDSTVHNHRCENLKSYINSN
jgi:hypothetical protein